jgi:hypothetical protein
MISTIKEMKLIINNISKYKTAGPNEFTDEFYQTFREETMSILYSFIEAEEIFHN